MKFEWRNRFLHRPSLHSCDWNGMLLDAWENGEWSVTKHDGRTVVSDLLHAKGKNLHDAQQRAQAAAMIEHSLCQQNLPDNGQGRTEDPQPEAEEERR